MKKLLIISLLLIPFVNAQFKSIGGALTQLMAGHSKGGSAPVDCEGYKDWLKENKEYYESLK